MYKLVEHVIDEINAKQLTGLALAGTLAASQLTAAHPSTHQPHHHHVAHHATHSVVNREIKHKVGDVLKGEASTYGWGEHLNPRTADGSPMDGSHKFVAMEVVPLGTIVTVYCPETDRSADFRVRDFGPRASTGRIIDLTAAAWTELGLNRDDGLANVVVTIKRLGTGRSYHGRI